MTSEVQESKKRVIQSFADFLDTVTPPSSSFEFDSFVVDGFLSKATSDERRLFEGWGTVEIRDNQGDLIPIKEFTPVMQKLMERGAPLLDGHSNRHVGKITGYEFRKKNGQMGLWLQGEIFDHYSSDDKVWREIKEGTITGFSLGGRGKSDSRNIEYDSSGKPVKKIEDLEVWEFSVVRKPANPEATIEHVNILAKDGELEKKMSWDECVAKMKEQYGEDDEKVYATCNALANEGKVEPCPTKKEDIAKDKVPTKYPWDQCIADRKREGYSEESAKKICGTIRAKTHGFKTKSDLFIDYAKKKGVARLDALDILDKCDLCKEYINDLIKDGLTKGEALFFLQKEIDTILKENLEAKREMAIEKQEPEPGAEAPAVDESGKNAMILQEILKRIEAIEQIVFPEAKMAAEEKTEEPKVEPEVKPENLQAEIQKQFHDFIKGLTVASTERPLEKKTEEEKTVDLTQLSFKELFEIRKRVDPRIRDLAIRGY